MGEVSRVETYPMVLQPDRQKETKKRTIRQTIRPLVGSFLSSSSAAATMLTSLLKIAAAVGVEEEKEPSSTHRIDPPTIKHLSSTVDQSVRKDDLLTAASFFF